jgi:hypothetical protein
VRLQPAEAVGEEGSHVAITTVLTEGGARLPDLTDLDDRLRGTAVPAQGGLD